MHGGFPHEFLSTPVSRTAPRLVGVASPARLILGCLLATVRGVILSSQILAPQNLRNMEKSFEILFNQTKI